MTGTNVLRNVSAVTLVGVLVLMTTGCTTQELMTKNRTLGERLEKIEGENQRLKVENEKNIAQLDKQKQELDDKGKEIAGLQKDVEDKVQALLKLKEMYDELKNKPRLVIGQPLPKKLNEALQQFATANPDIAEFDEKNGMVKLRSDLTFPLGSAMVTEEAEKTLVKLAKILDSPDAKKFSVYIAGHTDDVPISRVRRKHPTNWYLSVHRAVGVQMAMEQAGLGPSRIAVLGFSEYHPVKPNKPGKKGNQLNRRVEIWIVPAGQFLTPEAKQP